MHRKIKLVMAIIVIILVVLGVWAIWFRHPAIPEDSKAVLQEEQQAPTRVLTMVDLKAHATAVDCWIAVSGVVYDVTSFVQSGASGHALAGSCGTDGTATFAGLPEADKGKAEAALQSHRMGDLAQ